MYGNEAMTQYRKVVVIDDQPPTITVTGLLNYTLEYSRTGIFTDNMVTAYDEYDGDISVTTDLSGLVLNQLGTYTITCSASDLSGNIAESKYRTVIVNDTTPPVITLNGNQTTISAIYIPFSDNGAQVTDRDDERIIYADAKDTVDYNNSSTYILQYNTQDSIGNIANTMYRTVQIKYSTVDTVTAITQSVKAIW